ncbi:hypothetical protein PSHT_07964 [Puccinia striiformis]|uniref:Uncharacterized protein n=1 Tax=Puccinia striiformis TaxID=27350 RepID=A0A2S4VTK0_9BASI|nr:hypothetical protein PSHT_07964 [Puccinia striiformis]
MPRSKTYRREGIPSDSSRQYNKQMSKFLPKFDTPFCQSIYDFIKMLIVIENRPNPNYPVITFMINKDSLDDRSVFFDPNALLEVVGYAGKKKSIPTNYKLLFLKHLSPQL